MTDARLTALKRHWRSATRRYRDPWTTTSGGLQLHTDSGMWGQVVLRDPRVHPSHVTLGIFAGSLHPYLMRVVNKLDPAKPPPPAFVAANGIAVWDVPVGFAVDAAGAPAPYVDKRPADHDWWDHPILGEATAEAWLADALIRIVPATEMLCTEDGLLAHLSGGTSSFTLRYACLLAAHLGQDGTRLAGLLDAAEEAWVREGERSAAMGLPRFNQDRQSRYPQSWSHQRFLRFLDETPR